MIIKGARGDLQVFEGDLLLGTDGHYRVLQDFDRVVVCHQVTGRVRPIVAVQHKMIGHMSMEVDGYGGVNTTRVVTDLDMAELLKQVRFVVTKTNGTEKAKYEYAEKRLEKTGRITIKQKREIEERAHELGYKQ